MQDFQESESIDLMLVVMPVMMMTTGSDFRLVSRIASESQAIVSVTVCVRHWAVSVCHGLCLCGSHGGCSLQLGEPPPTAAAIRPTRVRHCQYFQVFKSIFVSESWRPQVQVSVLFGCFLSGRFTPSYFKLIV